MLKYSIVVDDGLESSREEKRYSPDLPVYVFIGGAGTGPWMWKYQIDFFKGVKITFDLPGHDTNAEIDFVDIKNTCDLVVELIRHLTNQKVILIGHSIGAQIILRTLEDYPDIVKKAFVISALNKKMRWVKGMISPMIKLSMPLVKMRWFAKLQSRELGIQGKMFELYYNTSKSVNYQNLVDILRSNMTYEFSGTEVAGKDIHFIYGNKEKRIMAISAKKSHKLVEGSHLINLPSGHDIPYQCPQELNTYILNSL